jgi:hypothetical protein
MNSRRLMRAPSPTAAPYHIVERKCCVVCISGADRGDQRLDPEMFMTPESAISAAWSSLVATGPLLNWRRMGRGAFLTADTSEEMSSCPGSQPEATYGGRFGFGLAT